MADNSDFDVIKMKNLDKGTILKVSRNIMNGRLFVEFSSNNPRIVLQKNFQNSIVGKRECDDFAKSIKNTNQLRAYFGLKAAK
jgi:hypothetical protein